MLVAGCTTPQQDPGAEPQAQDSAPATDTASDDAAEVTLRGQPPTGALPIQIAEQHRFHQITLTPAGIGEQLDISKPNLGRPPEADEFDVTVETADGETSQTQAMVGFPLRVPYTDEPFTILFAPADGQPDSGTLTLKYDGGELVDEASDGKRPPEIDSTAVVYEVTLAWEEAEPGYAVVLRGQGTGVGSDQPGSARQFTARPEFSLPVAEGYPMAVAVYPGFDDPAVSSEAARALRVAPPIDPQGGVTTLVPPGARG